MADNQKGALYSAMQDKVLNDSLSSGVDTLVGGLSMRPLWPYAKRAVDGALSYADERGQEISDAYSAPEEPDRSKTPMDVPSNIITKGDPNVPDMKADRPYIKSAMEAMNFNSKDIIGIDRSTEELPHTKVDPKVAQESADQLKDGVSDIQQEAAVKQKEDADQKQKDSLPIRNGAEAERQSLGTGSPTAGLHVGGSSYGGYREMDVDTSQPPFGENKYTTEDDIRHKHDTEIGKQAADFHHAKTAWYEDNAFYQGLLRFGLGVMGGANPGEAFDAANHVYRERQGVEARTEWADQMTEDYDPRSIQAWIVSGDEKDLKSYRDMAYEQSKQEHDLNQWKSEATPEEQRYTRQIAREGQIINNERAKQLYEYAKADRPLEVAIKKAQLNNAYLGGQLTRANINKALHSAPTSRKMTEAEAKYYNAGLTNLDSNRYYEDLTKKLEKEWKAKGNKGEFLPSLYNTFGSSIAQNIIDEDGEVSSWVMSRMTPEQQELFNAQRRILENTGRIRSGNAVSASEWNKFQKELFATPSDTAGSIREKGFERTRDIVRNLSESGEPIYRRLTDLRLSGQIQDYGIDLQSGTAYYKDNRGKYHAYDPSTGDFRELDGQ